MTFNKADVLYSRSRKAYFMVMNKQLCENNVYQYTVYNITNGKYVVSFLPQGLYKKVG